MSRKLVFVALILPFLGGCAARSTLQIVQAEQALYLAREAEAPDRAVFEWTLAEQYMQKAREEWSHSDYGAADELARKSIHWAEQAEQAASDSAHHQIMDRSSDIVPEERAPAPVPEPSPDGAEDMGIEFGEERGVEHDTIDVPDADLYGEDDEDPEEDE